VQAKPIFIDDDVEEPFEASPADVKNWLVAFLDGFEIEKYANATADCRKDGDVFYNFMAAGVDNYIKKHYLEGSLNVSDALESLSPLSRTCYDTTEELSKAFGEYWKQFKNPWDFLKVVSINAMSNVKPIKKKGTLILTELLTTKNYTNVAFLSGQIATYIFVLDDEDFYMARKGGLTYTEADPLAPNPINDVMWIIFEGGYKFLINSQMASKAQIQTCQEGTLNMVLLDEKALELYKKGDHKNAWFTFADSLTFSHQIVDGCYHMGKEIGHTIGQIKEHGQIGKNILHNLYFIISGVMSTWSQIYYKDWLNMIGVLGGLTYRIFVAGAQ
jgi:hypothetical protein